MRSLILTGFSTLILAACSQPEEMPEQETLPPTTLSQTDIEASASMPSEVIDRAINDASRPEADVALDIHRHPAEILGFAGIERGWKVGDIVPGSGYYSRVLSTAVGENGHVYAFNPSWVAERFTDSNRALGELADSRINMSRIVGPIETFGESVEAPLDAVFMILFYHDTAYDGTDRAVMNQSIYDSLRPGGVFLIIDHHAPAGSGLEAVQTTHRIDSSVVVEEVTAAGFVLEAEDDMLSNANDPRHISVFDDSIRRQTDRFVYRFRKPE